MINRGVDHRPNHAILFQTSDGRHRLVMMQALPLGRHEGVNCVPAAPDLQRKNVESAHTFFSDH